MYSEALAIADRNTVRLMIDDMKDQNDELKKQYNNLKEQNNGLKEQNNDLSVQNNGLKEQVSSLTTQVTEKEMENLRLKQLLLDSGINPDQALSI